MEDAALIDPHPAIAPTDLFELVRQLRCEVLQLRQEVAELRCENSELRQQVGYWKAQHARAVHRAEHLEAEVENLRGENRKLQDQLFARKSEKSSTQARSNHLQGENDDQDSATPPKLEASGKIGPARRGGITATCQSSRTSTSRPKTNAFAPSVVRPSLPVTPRILNRSRSRCGRIADASGGAATSGHADCAEVSSNLPRLRLPPS